MNTLTKKKRYRKYPAEVDILDVSDISRWDPNSEEGRTAPAGDDQQTLAGWAIQNFTPWDKSRRKDIDDEDFDPVSDDDDYEDDIFYNDINPRVIDCLQWAADRLGHRSTGFITMYQAREVVNEELEQYGQFIVPKADLARIWNLGMAYLGYTNGNPEAANCETYRQTHPQL